MPEYFLVSRHGTILNVATGDRLTRERAAEIMRCNDANGERVTQHVTDKQLRDYEQDHGQ